MVDRRNMPVEDFIRSQLQSEEEFTDQRSSHFRLCVAVDFKSLYKVFPRPFTHGGTSAGGQSVNGGGLMRGDIDLMGGGPNFDRLYHKLKVLLLLSCNYTMQIISYDSIKTR